MCNLEELGFKSSKYIVWSSRTNENCIFKRLDRVLCNNTIQNIFSVVEVEYLIRSGLDHTLILLKFSISNEEIMKSFKLLNFWLKEVYFKKVVRQHWKGDFEGNPFSLFHYKLKIVKKAINQ